MRNRKTRRALPLAAALMAALMAGLTGCGQAAVEQRGKDVYKRQPQQGLFDDAVLHVQAQLAGALLGCAPAHTMGVAADVLDLIGLDPVSYTHLDVYKRQGWRPFPPRCPPAH